MGTLPHAEGLSERTYKKCKVFSSLELYCTGRARVTIRRESGISDGTTAQQAHIFTSVSHPFFLLGRLTVAEAEPISKALTSPES